MKLTDPSPTAMVLWKEYNAKVLATSALLSIIITIITALAFNFILPL